MAKNGNKGLMTCDTETLATPLPTKSNVPTGGVQMPIHKFKTITIPKCTGSMPRSVTTGKKIGVNIRTAGVISINVPIINRIILIANRMANLLLTDSNKKLLIISGIPSKENSQDIAIEVQIKNMTTAVVFALDNKTLGKSVVFISPYIKARIAAYSTAITDASVAVKTPATIPPTTTTNNKRLKNAFLK